MRKIIAGLLATGALVVGFATVPSSAQATPSSPTADAETARKSMTAQEWANVQKYGTKDPGAKGSSSPGKSDPKLKVRHDKNGKDVSGRLVGTRKATQADVASGFAASTTATISLCTGEANLKSPESGVLNSHDWLSLGWEESTSPGNAPEARVNAGNAIFVHNDNPRIIYFSGSQWDNIMSGYHFGWSTWAYTFTYLNQVAANGGQLGQKVQTDGLINVDAASGSPRWKNVQSFYAGYRTFVSINGSTGQYTTYPGIVIYEWGSGSYADQSSRSVVEVNARNDYPCGNLVAEG